jgi:multidrug resistance efflux pump
MHQMTRHVAMFVGLIAAVGGGLASWLWRDFEPSLTLPGAVEIQEVRLASKVGGRVSAVYVEEGESVAAGDSLVEFEIPELLAQRGQWQAKLSAAEARLERLRNGSREEEKRAASAQYAWAVARRDRVLAGPRPEEVEQARGEVERIQADVKRIRQELSRIEPLRAQKITTESQYEELVAGLNRSQALERIAQARLRELELGSREEDKAEAEADVARMLAQADLVMAGARVEDIREAEASVAELQARLEELEVNIRESQIRAPSSVLVEVVSVRAGDMVLPNQPVVRVLRAEDLWIKAFVPETEMGRIRLNQAVAVTVDSYPGRTFEGRITHIASISEFTPRNVQSADERRHQVFAIKVRVADNSGVFKSGMAAEIRVPLK